MKKILFLIAVATLATSCNNDDKWDATGTFEATEVVVSAQGSISLPSASYQVIWRDWTRSYRKPNLMPIRTT